MIRKSKKEVQKICVYCGVNIGSTKDHVVPKCLFTSPLPLNMVTVPACSQCNNKNKALDESYFRDVLVIDIDGSSHPVALELFQTKVVRSVQRSRSEAAREAINNVRFVPYLLPSGFYIGQLPSFEVDMKRINNVISYIVRGLYYHMLRERLPIECIIEAQRIEGIDVDVSWKFLQEFGCSSITTLGQNVFGFAFTHALEEPSVSFWLLVFYEKIFFRVYTNSQLIPS